MNIDLRKSLTGDEFRDAMDLYEKTTGEFWIPVKSVESQIVWLAAFERAKEYYGKAK